MSSFKKPLKSIIVFYSRELFYSRIDFLILLILRSAIAFNDIFTENLSDMKSV